MKAYNTPKDELHIESDTGETLVSITPEKTTIANLEGGGGEIFYPVYIIDDGEGNYTSDKTINEILSAMDENKIPVVIYEACEHWYNVNVGVNEIIFTNVKPAVITNAISYSITDIRITNGNEVAITSNDAVVAATIT